MCIVVHRVAHHNHLIDRYYLLFIPCKINRDGMSQELHLIACIHLRMTEHPSPRAINLRHLLGCDTIEAVKMFLSRFNVVTITTEIQ